MEYIPIVQPKDIALKNTGKTLLLRVKGREFEMRSATLKQLCEIADFIRTSKHPTEWISGYEDMVKEETMSLWPEDTDDLP